MDTTHRKSIKKLLFEHKNVENFRSEIDAIILELWDQVESANMNLPSKMKIDKNKEYGIVYYYRKGETVK